MDKWNELKNWLNETYDFYCKSSVYFSSESAHCTTLLDAILCKMNKLERIEEGKNNGL